MVREDSYEAGEGVHPRALQFVLCNRQPPINPCGAASYHVYTDDFGDQWIQAEVYRQVRLYQKMNLRYFPVDCQVQTLERADSRLGTETTSRASQVLHIDIVSMQPCEQSVFVPFKDQDVPLADLLVASTRSRVTLTAARSKPRLSRL